VLLDTVTVSTPQTNADFTSISQAYDDLEVVVLGRGDTAANGADCDMQLGSGSVDTGSNYRSMAVRHGDGTDAFEGQDAAASMQAKTVVAGNNSDALTRGLVTWTIHDYTDTTYQTFVSHVGGALPNSANRYGCFGTGQWSTVTAVDTVRVKCDAGDWDAGTVVKLFGIVH